MNPWDNWTFVDFFFLCMCVCCSSMILRFTPFLCVFVTIGCFFDLVSKNIWWQISVFIYFLFDFFISLSHFFIKHFLIYFELFRRYSKLFCALISVWFTMIREAYEPICVLYVIDVVATKTSINRNLQ